MQRADALAYVESQVCVRECWIAVCWYAIVYGPGLTAVFLCAQPPPPQVSGALPAGPGTRGLPMAERPRFRPPSPPAALAGIGRSSTSGDEAPSPFMTEDPTDAPAARAPTAAATVTSGARHGVAVGYLVGDVVVSADRLCSGQWELSRGRFLASATLVVKWASAAGTACAVGRQSYLNVWHAALPAPDAPRRRACAKSLPADGAPEAPRVQPPWSRLSKRLSCHRPLCLAARGQFSFLDACVW